MIAFGAAVIAGVTIAALLHAQPATDVSFWWQPHSSRQRELERWNRWRG